MSRSADNAVGMMDAAYFVGRKELLEFFNSLLDLNLAKIEQTASGAVACQLTEIIFPGSIPMARVNWEARSDYEFVQNYKLLQVAFTKHRVQRHVDVDKLIRAKYQDNLEFCQWLKAFYDQTAGPLRDDYNPTAVRLKGKGGKRYNDKMGRITRGGGSSRPHPAGGGGGHGAPVGSNKTTTSTTGMRNSGPLRERSTMNSPDKKRKDVEHQHQQQHKADAELIKKNEELEAQVADLEPKIFELETAVIATEKERDFYFEKLRHVEVILQVHQEKGEESDPNALVDKVFKVLYAVPEDQLVVNEDGDILEGGPQQEEVLDEP